LDKMGGVGLQAERIKEAARRTTGGRIVSVLEDGYALHALGRSVAAHLKVLGDL
jgi:acetoin utilization deacetylase AcuC-like enzyme